MTGLFVTGTDTGVGTTVLTGALVLAFKAHGFNVGVIKPVQSGAVAAGAEGDAMLLKIWTESSDPIEEIVPFAFAMPLAPLIAARHEGSKVTLHGCVEVVRAYASRYEVLVVEGAGGVRTPIGESFTIVEFVAELGYPVVVVARATLGTVNHVALTVEALRARELKISGVVLNGVRDESSATNASLIESIADVKVVGQTLYIDGNLTSLDLVRHGNYLDLSPNCRSLNLQGGTNIDHGAPSRSVPRVPE